MECLPLNNQQSKHSGTVRRSEVTAMMGQLFIVAVYRSAHAMLQRLARRRNNYRRRYCSRVRRDRSRCLGGTHEWIHHHAMGSFRFTLQLMHWMSSTALMQATIVFVVVIHMWSCQWYGTRFTREGLLEVQFGHFHGRHHHLIGRSCRCRGGVRSRGRIAQTDTVLVRFASGMHELPQRREVLDRDAGGFLEMQLLVARQGV